MFRARREGSSKLDTLVVWKLRPSWSFAALGAIVNIGVAAYVFNRQSEWLLAAIAAA